MATIDEIDRSGETVRVRATVSEAWKVSTPGQITFLSGETCAYDVGVGQKHLLFLYSGEGGVYGTCGAEAVGPSPNAKKSIAWLKRFGKSAGVGTEKN